MLCIIFTLSKKEKYMVAKKSVSKIGGIELYLKRIFGLMAGLCLKVLIKNLRRCL